MVGFILIIMGVIFIAAGVFAGNIINQAAASVGGLGDMSNIFTIAFGGVGALLVLFGFLSVLRGRRAVQVHKEVLANGIDAKGTVTYVDKNYRVLINNRPVYSIVEYKYHDASGMEYVNRIDQVSTESVIRSGIQVGSTINIRYLPDNPEKSTIVPMSA